MGVSETRVTCAAKGLSSSSSSSASLNDDRERRRFLVGGTSIQEEDAGDSAFNERAEE